MLHFTDLFRILGFMDMLFRHEGYFLLAVIHVVLVGLIRIF